MVTLAVDTALGWAEAAVVDGGRILGAAGAPSAGDAEAIVGHAGAALAAAGLDYGALSRVAVTIGPGSFTGVRVGIAFAKGVAFARGIPAVGVSTLAVIARMAGLPALAAVDARHGAVFAALYLGADPEFEARMTAGDARAAAAGAAIAGDAAAVAALGGGRVVDRLELAIVADLAGGDPTGRQPRALYLAPVDAAPQGHKALARA
jgi:tRNA threonylcarbamoyl adenosine modification protein YeaZ